MPLRVLRYLDLCVLVLALPIFIAAGLPLLGWAGAAVGWTLQRVIQAAIERRARASDDPRTVAGLPTTANPRSIMSLAVSAFRSGGGEASIALNAPTCEGYSM